MFHLSTTKITVRATILFLISSTKFKFVEFVLYSQQGYGNYRHRPSIGRVVAAVISCQETDVECENIMTGRLKIYVIQTKTKPFRQAHCQHRLL